MIEVLAGTNPESDVADAGTVKVSSVGDVAGTSKLLKVSIYPPPHPRQHSALITVHTNATVMDILNKAATLLRMSPKSVGAHYLSFGTRNSHDPASTLEEIRVQAYGLIQLLAQASGGECIIYERIDILATSLDCEDRQTLFLATCGSRISSPNLADKSRVIGEYGGNVEPISSRHFDITECSPDQVDVNSHAKKSRLMCIQVRPDTVIRDIARQAALEFQLSQDHLEACRFCWGCDREEALTSTKKLHEVGVHSHCEIHMLMRLQGGVASRRQPREQVAFNREPCHLRRVLHLLCPQTCECGNSLQCMEGKTEVIRGYRLNASGAKLIATRDIAKGDVVAVFGKTATLWTSKHVDVKGCA